MLDNASRSLDALTLPEISGTGRQRGSACHTGDCATLCAGQPDQPAWTGPSADRPVVADTGDGIDPEILELFIEEAREAIESINTNFPRWALDDSELDALQTVRRAYHTLKGSGRMVGAELIGEYCWSIEHLLNRVIDGTVAELAGAECLYAAGEQRGCRTAGAAGSGRRALQRHCRADG